MVDTFPVERLQPEDSYLAKSLYNPKYGGTVFKFQNVVDFLGRIVYFSGPHLGTTHDDLIWRESLAYHPLHPSEMVLADGAYSAESQLVCPYRFLPHTHLTPSQYTFNSIHAHYRARVEHMNAKLKRHNILGGKFRGRTMEELANAAHILAHVQNVHQHLFWSYEPFGPHLHF